MYFGDTLKKPVLERETVSSQNRMKVTFKHWIDFDNKSA